MGGPEMGPPNPPLARRAPGNPWRASITGHVLHLHPAAGLDRLAAGLAEWARLGRPRRRRHGGEGRPLHIERGGAAAPVDQRADADDGAPARPHALHHLAGRAAGGDDVLDDEAALTGRQREPAPQPHHAVLALRKERAHAERARHLVGHEDAADGGGEHALGAGVAERGGQRVAEPRRVLRILKNQRRLQINVGVQARRQAEVAPHERAGLFIQFEGLPLGQCRHDPIICQPARTPPGARQAGVPDAGAVSARPRADASLAHRPTVSSRLTSARAHPLALAAPWQPRCTSAAHAALARRPGPMAKVMVVDDAQSDLKLMESILRGAGHEVVSLTDGEKLEDRMQAEHPDVLLLDIVMPRRNGYEILRALRRDTRTRTTPVVLVSSKNQESDRAWGKKQGADEYLSKPFTSDQLLSVEPVCPLTTRSFPAPRRRPTQRRHRTRRPYPTPSSPARTGAARASWPWAAARSPWTCARRAR